MTIDIKPLRLSLLTSSLIGLLSTACVIEELPADDEAGDSTSEGDTTSTDTSTDSSSDTSSDTSSETTGGGGICPGSEEFCSEAESHCDEQGLLQICQYDPEQDCIFHASADCSVEVGPGSMCVTVSPTEGGCTQAAEPAHIRFLNLSDGYEVGFRVGGQEAVGVDLLFTESAPYMDFPAGVDITVDVIDPQGNVLSNSVYPEFVAGHKYTVAAMGLGIWPDTWVSPDQHVDDLDVPADNTRLTLVNGTPDNDNGIYAQLVYDNEYFIDFYNEHDSMLLEYVQQVTVDAPLPTVQQSDFMALAAQWGVPAVYAQYWKGAAFAQVANNESIYVFLTCTGTCDSDADRFVLGMMEDSSTFTVELLAP